MRIASSRTRRIGLLGCGTVGACFAATIARERLRLAAETGIDVAIAKILVRRPNHPRALPHDLFTDRFEDVLAARPDVIVEVLGGLEPATSHIRRALEAGIAVVTANKTVIAHHGSSLQALAAGRGTLLAYEAAVCAAVPILSVLQQLRGDRVRSIHGILNGSTNYILTRMSSQPLSLSDALIEAKERGLIEPDHTADLSGRDAAEKLAILAREAGFDGIDYGSIDVAGIEHVTADDILAARRQGCTIKLVAVLERTTSARGDEEISLRVGPMLVPRGHRLATVDHARNAVIIDAELGGQLSIEGTGAGPRPTSSALIGDLLRIARLVRGGGTGSTPCPGDVDDLVGVSSEPSATPPKPVGKPIGTAHRYYIRAQVPPGLQSPQDVIEAFREAGIGLKSIDLRSEVARVWTLPATRESVRSAVARISAQNDTFVAPVLDPPGSSGNPEQSAGSGAGQQPLPPVQHHALVHLVRRRLSA